MTDRVHEILSCQIERLPRLLDAPGYLDAKMPALLALVSTREPAYPDSLRFELVLMSLIRVGGLSLPVAQDILKAVESAPAWQYGGLILAVHLQDILGDEWVVRHYSRMDAAMRGIARELATRKRPQLAAQLAATYPDARRST